MIIEGDTGYKVIPFRNEYKSNTCEYDCCIYFWNFILLQDCFKQNWSEHRKVHKSAKAAGTGVPHYTQTKPGFHQFINRTHIDNSSITDQKWLSCSIIFICYRYWSFKHFSYINIFLNTTHVENLKGLSFAQYFTCLILLSASLPVTFHITFIDLIVLWNCLVDDNNKPVTYNPWPGYRFTGKLKPWPQV